MVLMSRSMVSLSEMVNNQKGIFFASLVKREERQSKDGKLYYRAVFGDSHRKVSAMIWEDSPLFQECRNGWKEGGVYKIEATFLQTKYGHQIQISRIRETKEKDFEDGVPPQFIFPHSETDPAILFDELISLVKTKMSKGSQLQTLILRIFKEYREKILKLPSSREHHHSYPGGFLEHTLSVTKISSLLADHFAAAYHLSRTRFSKDLVIAGATLHEIGKIAEMDSRSITPKHTLEGDLLGYPILGRDILRKTVQETEVDSATLLQLEHIILAHPRFTDWGAVKIPASLEALVVHQADYADSLFATSNKLISTDAGEGSLTSYPGPLGIPLLKHLPKIHSENNSPNSSANLSEDSP